MKIDPVQVLWGLRRLEKPEFPVLAIPGLGIVETVMLTAALLERGPLAIGYMGLDPGRHWYAMTPDPAAVVGIQASTIAVEASELRVVPSTDPLDPWVALILEGEQPSTAGKEEIDPDDRSRRSVDISGLPLGGTGVPQLHSGLLQRAGLVGVPALRAAGVVGEHGELTLGALLCLSRGVAPPVPSSWTIVVERYDADPATVRRYARAAVEVRCYQPPLPLAIDTIVDELSVEPPFRGRHSGQVSEVIREILVNAVVHRRYASHEVAPVQVICHPDRIVVVSPGPWASSAGGEDAGEAPETIPNPRLHALMARLGLCQQQGMGVDRARLFARAVGMRLELERGESFVRASLVVDRSRSLEMNGPCPGAAPRVMMSSSVRRERVLEFLGRRESASKREIAEALETSLATVAATLRALREEGLVMMTERSSRSPGQGYRRL